MPLDRLGLRRSWISQLRWNGVKVACVLDIVVERWFLYIEGKCKALAQQGFYDCQQLHELRFRYQRCPQGTLGAAIVATLAALSAHQ